MNESYGTLSGESERITGYTHNHLALHNTEPPTLSFVIGWQCWTGTLLGIYFEFNYTAKKSKRPYVVVVLGPLKIQAGWLF